MPGVSSTARSLLADVGRGGHAKRAVATSKRVVEDFGSDALSCPVLSSLSRASQSKAVALIGYIAFVIYGLKLLGLCNIGHPNPYIYNT